MYLDDEPQHSLHATMATELATVPVKWSSDFHQSSSGNVRPSSRRSRALLHVPAAANPAWRRAGLPVVHGFETPAHHSRHQRVQDDRSDKQRPAWLCFSHKHKHQTASFFHSFVPAKTGRYKVSSHPSFNFAPCTCGWPFRRAPKISHLLSAVRYGCAWLHCLPSYSVRLKHARLQRPVAKLPM